MSGRRAKWAAAATAAAALLLWTAPARADDESPLGYIEMPASEDGTWVLAHPPGSGRNWGKPVFIRYLVAVAQEWRRRHPDGPVLRLGDLSKPDGSAFPPHKTHRDGLTADLFTTRPKNICHVDYPDQELTLELAQLLYDYGARQILYNGDLVVETLPVAQKWPKHDDHFHIVIDPARVPAEGALMVLPERRRAEGTWVGAADLKEDRTGLELAWRVLGQASLRSYKVLVDDLDDANGVLHDSGPLRSRDMRYALPIPLQHGQRLRWRVELELREGEPVGCSWQGFQVDLQAPTVTPLEPADEADVDGPPVLRWRYRKEGVPQASYAIEVDRDPNHRRISHTFGPHPGEATSFPFPGAALRRNKGYYWRVVVSDAHGNSAATPWRRFKTSSAYKDRPAGEEAGGGKRGRVTASALNMREGPGTGHPVVATLSRDTEVRVLAERDGWLEVLAPGPSGVVRGFVSARYVDVE